MTSAQTTINIPGNCIAAIIAAIIASLQTLPEGQHVILGTPLGQLDAVRYDTHVTVFPLDAQGQRGDTGRKRGHQGVSFHTFSTVDMHHAIGVVLNRARRMAT